MYFKEAVNDIIKLKAIWPCYTVTVANGGKQYAPQQSALQKLLTINMCLPHPSNRPICTAPGRPAEEVWYFDEEKKCFHNITSTFKRAHVQKHTHSNFCF